MSKQEQRRYIKDLLRTKPLEYLDEQSALASEELIALLEFQNANTILAYMAMKRECDPKIAVKKARELGIAVAFPLCVEDNQLQILVPYDEDAFVVGAYGILEPDINHSAILSPNDLDLIIVPGLGFDSMGHRLGRGAGYYDRLLNQSRAYKVGFCFREQLLDQVCTEAHDIPVDKVIFPKK